MSTEVKNELLKINSQFESIRHKLDYIMYGTNISDEDFDKVRNIYDSICKIQDNMF